MKKISVMLKPICFLLLFLFSLYLVTSIFKAKWIKEFGGWEPATAILDGFYEEESAIDVLFLGSSHVFDGVNPLAIWKEFGISSYVMGSSAQRIWISSAYLKEALRYQKPEAVVFDVGGVLNPELNDENRNRKALDPMRFSPIKIGAVSASIPTAGENKESLFSYFFPIMRYHTRWKELDKTDFCYPFSNKHYYAKGHVVHFNTVPYGKEHTFYDPNEDYPAYEISEKNKSYLNSMLDLCSKNGISLILIKVPAFNSWNYSSHLAIRQYAKEKGIPFIDYNLNYQAIGIDPSTCLIDEVHFNFKGAEIFSKELGEYLSGNFDLEDKRAQPAYAQWNTDYEQYEHRKYNYFLTTQTDPQAYWDMLNNPQYTILLTAAGDVRMKIDAATEEKLLALGSSLGAADKKQQHYAAVLRNGKATYEESSPEDIDHHVALDDLSIRLMSGKKNSMKIDGKNVAKNSGLMVTVYDSLTQEVIDMASYNPDDRGLYR